MQIEPGVNCVVFLLFQMSPVQQNTFSSNLASFRNGLSRVHDASEAKDNSRRIFFLKVMRTVLSVPRVKRANVVSSETFFLKVEITVLSIN